MGRSRRSKVIDRWRRWCRIGARGLAPKISQLPGVGLVSLSGGQRPAVRIQANPTSLAALGLTLEDLRVALAAANVNQAKGNFDGAHQSYTIGANDQLLSSADYAPLIVAYKNGAPVRLTDVATVTNDVENVRQAAWKNTTPAVIVNIQRQPGANIIAVADRVKSVLPQLTATLPTAVQVGSSPIAPTRFALPCGRAVRTHVDGGAGGHGHFPFPAQLPATSVPSVAVPLSLVGTLGVMYLLGYSLNNLTLMALTISTGFVVDDAIVMIENITRFMENGETPLQAALKGAEQIGFTIVSLTISLIAVLIPLLFMGDIVGRLFREFAVTLSVTILVSAVVSLTLTPMMSASVLSTPRPDRAFLPGLRARLRRSHRILRPDLQVSCDTRPRLCWWPPARSCSPLSVHRDPQRVSSRFRTPASSRAYPRRPRQFPSLRCPSVSSARRHHPQGPRWKVSRPSSASMAPT